MGRGKGYVVIGIVCLFYWIMDSVWSYMSFEINLKKLIFSEPKSYIDTFLLRVSPYQIVSRIIVVFLFVIFGVLVVKFIEKRKKAENELRDAHDTFFTILNSIDATIYVADMQNYEILFMNKYMVDSFGGNFLGQKCHKAFRNSDVVCDDCPNEKIVDESGNPNGVIFCEGLNPIKNAWYANYDKAIKWIDGRIVHLQIATDITQLKALQEKQKKADEHLRQVQKMESIGNLAGGIAHDFNNILFSIIGFTELALDEAPQNSSIQDNLKEIYKAGKRAKDLVGQILVFARQSEENTSPIQVDVIIKEALKFIRSSIPTTIEIKSSINSESLIMGNQTQVHQIIMNLCTNAAQAMDEEGGTLYVSLKDIVMDREMGKKFKLRNGDYIELSVSDNGTGIHPDILDSIFDPYFTTKKIGEGTGLGLAMVHGIATSYGGRVLVESTLGKGSIFTVYFPITRKRKKHRAYEPENLPHGNEKILFVDDEEQIAKIGSLVLERLGYQVVIQTGSIDALELFRSKPNHFDLIITDMTMPNMTGDKLAIELIKIRPEIPVILCTGFSKKVSDEIVSEIGIKALVHKPIDKSGLATIVRKILDETYGCRRV